MTRKNSSAWADSLMFIALLVFVFLLVFLCHNHWSF